MRIVLVGAGAAGSLVLLDLARRVAAGQGGAGPWEVTVLDPADPVTGAAFGTTDPRHLLNVPAAGMSADPEDRFDFSQWCVERGLVDADDASYWFAPRREWARYLRERLEAALVGAGERLQVSRVHSEAVGFDRAGELVEVRTGAGQVLVADRVVVATGLPAVGDDWSPVDLSGPRYVADPWRPGALAELGAGDGDVVVVGTGLTMVDVALSVLDRPGRRVVALSRSGDLPHPHAPAYLGEVVPDTRSWGASLAEIVAAAHAHTSAVAQLQGDWRPGIDGIRYRVADLWARLGEADRATFLREFSRAWGVRRHRMPPSSASTLAQASAEGRLEVRAAKVSDVDLHPDGVEVTTADGRRIRAGWLVNCTGPRPDLRTLANPALDALLGIGGGTPWARTDGLGLGLRTRDGRLTDPVGIEAPVWTLGALRRGELWESTAIPEIRVQAREVAGALLAD